MKWVTSGGNWRIDCRMLSFTELGGRCNKVSLELKFTVTVLCTSTFYD